MPYGGPASALSTVGKVQIGFDHIGLAVKNLESTRRFFCECLGWKVVGEKPITLTGGYLPIACFQEPSHRQSRTMQVLRPTYSNVSPFRSNRPRKNEGHSAPDRTCALA
jgi:catechol 2,3-dioxygenase-like lactoylglutathione lyase family enzyme